ncbi:zinc finger protein 420-like [Spodoptera frugiperda]|uniref:Zinc finger protein 420-like n=1 Tax=Spodoptera frugiperda TaxID=7108 RepID=A0A9R0F2Q1_SPOFR|nr:zinc finger protein 420-like [Spodoptera frugiperda]
MSDDTDHLICRLCLNNDNLIPLFDGTTEDSDFSDLLYLTTGITIQPNDGLPQKICEKCKLDVYSAIYLRNRSEESEAKLLEAGYQKTGTETITIDTGIETANDVTETIDNCDNNDDMVPSNNNTNDEKSHFNIKNCDILQNNINKYDETAIGNKMDDIDLNDYEIVNGFPELKADKIDKLIDNVDMTRLPIAIELRKVSSKEKRQQYLSMVEGQFDPKGPIKCKVCKSIVRNWSCFLSHAKKHIGFDFMCEFCGKSFIGSHQLKRHCRSYHGMKRDIACKHCDYLALDNAQMRLHVRRMHTFERPFVCDDCGASYHSRRCLIQHIDCHRPVTIAQCEDCPKTFKTPLQLTRHRWRCHRRNSTLITDLKS